jgi:hypothetical protein
VHHGVAAGERAVGLARVRQVDLERGDAAAHGRLGLREDVHGEHGVPGARELLHDVDAQPPAAARDGDAHLCFRRLCVGET